MVTFDSSASSEQTSVQSKDQPTQETSQLAISTHVTSDTSMTNGLPMKQKSKIVKMCEVRSLDFILIPYLKRLSLPENTYKLSPQESGMIPATSMSRKKLVSIALLPLES